MKNQKSEGGQVLILIAIGFTILAGIALMITSAPVAGEKVGRSAGEVFKEVQWQMENNRAAEASLADASFVYLTPAEQAGQELATAISLFHIPNPKIVDMEDLYILLQSYSITHADKHAEYNDVRNCMDNQGASFRIQIKPSKYVDICQMLGGWGFQPWKLTQTRKGGIENWEEITAYQKSDINTLQDLINYCARHGRELYQNINGVWQKLPF